MKALCVFSGGLDSMLAAALVRAQGINVLALFFETPFFTSKRAQESARSMNLPFRVVDLTARHLEVVKHPKHGYGGNMNPCIDCHALMFRVSGELLQTEGASFVISGEVLGQRPLSQNRHALSKIASESGIGPILLRPLSARLLPLTIPEEKRWVRRELLMDFQGRSRKPQIQLASKLGVDRYPSPGGGCLLTDRAFSKRLRDLFTHDKDACSREIELLKLGRHFRIGSAKIVVGRNKGENEAILALSRDEDLVLEAVSSPGPTVLVSGEITREGVDLAAAITLAYSDARVPTDVLLRGKGGEMNIKVALQDKETFRPYMI